MVLPTSRLGSSTAHSPLINPVPILSDMPSPSSKTDLLYGPQPRTPESVTIPGHAMNANLKSTTVPNLATVKTRQKAVWESGDYGQVARVHLNVAEESVSNIALHQSSPLPGARRGLVRILPGRFAYNLFPELILKVSVGSIPLGRSVTAWFVPEEIHA